MAKLGAISDEQARRSLDRYDALEQAKPTAGQVGRYGALGAGAGALTHAVSRGLEGRSPITPRSLGGAAAAGAIGMGAVPLVRGMLDRAAEKGTLRKYMTQEHVGQYASNPNTETGGLAGPPTALTKMGFYPALKGIGGMAAIGGVGGGLLGAAAGNRIKSKPNSDHFAARHPTLTNALIGAGVGAGTMGLGTAGKISELMPGRITKELKDFSVKARAAATGLKGDIALHIPNRTRDDAVNAFLSKYQK